LISFLKYDNLFTNTKRERIIMHTILIEEPTGTIEYTIITSHEPNDQPIQCGPGHNLTTGQEEPPLPLNTLIQKIITLTQPTPTQPIEPHF
jgi:hypothetical protein